MSLFVQLKKRYWLLVTWLDLTTLAIRRPETIFFCSSYPYHCLKYVGLYSRWIGSVTTNLKLALSSWKVGRQRAMTALSSRCRRTTVLKDWRYIDGFIRVGWRFADGNSYRSKESIHVPSVPSSHSLSTQHFFFVETAHPSSLHVPITWLSCKLASLLVGIGSFSLRAKWTSTSAVRRLRSLLENSAGVGSCFLTLLSSLISPDKPVWATLAYRQEKYWTSPIGCRSKEC
jgi:hypothetical protein